jgi:NADPH:quinone reductase-like Zn-dependent oxidoreductase
VHCWLNGFGRMTSRRIRELLLGETSAALLIEPFQLGKYFGANVIGTVSTPEKAALAKSNGADHILLTSSPSSENVSTILSLTGGKGVHAVYDGVGKDTWEEDFEVVRPKATIVTFGNASGPVPPFAPLKLSPKALKVTRPTLGPFIAEPEDFARYAKEIFEIVQKGGLKVSRALFKATILSAPKSFHSFDLLEPEARRKQEWSYAA